jgi:hypothetical protein
MHPGIAMPIGAARGPSSLLSSVGNNFGNMTASGGISNAFDGVTSQATANCAEQPTVSPSSQGWLGRTLTRPVQIDYVNVFGANDNGFIQGSNPSITIQLYGKQGAEPSGSAGGTLLGSITFTDTANESAGRQIVSSDKTTYWDCIWIRITHTDGGDRDVLCAELQMYGWNFPGGAARQDMAHHVFATDATTFTASGVTWGGTQDARRHIAVGLVAASAGQELATSLTIGGVAATRVVSSPAGLNPRAEIWIAAIPTGTSGNVVATFPVTKDRCGMAVWRLELSSIAPIDTGNASDTTTGISSTTCDVTAGSVAVGISQEVSSSGGVSAAWTGLDFDRLSDIEGTRYMSSASKLFTADEANRAISADWAAVVTNVLAVASFK